MAGERRGEEGMPLLVWLLFTRISGAYVNPPSASHLSTHTHAHTYTCMRTRGWHNVWVWAADVFAVHFFLLVRLFVHLSVCRPAGTLSACNSVFHVWGIVLFTDTAYIVLVKLETSDFSCFMGRETLKSGHLADSLFTVICAVVVHCSHSVDDVMHDTKHTPSDQKNRDTCAM